MDALGRQPLFKLLGAVIVLALADQNPVWGAAAAAVWATWIYLSYHVGSNSTSPDFRFLQ